MKISIVTCCFNQADYVAATLQSVLRQGYSDLEYIVVDPGSTDGSRAIIQSFGSEISATILEPDSGAAEGLNRGFARASGNILGFLNADDLLLPGSFHRIAAYFNQHHDCDILAGNGFMIDAQGRILRRIRARHLTTTRYLHAQRQWIQQAVFFRRECYERCAGFNPLNRTCWDGELLLGMLRSGATVGYIAADLAAFRIHPASNTGAGTNGREYREDCRRIFQENSGREWRGIDTALQWLYRGEAILDRVKDNVLAYCCGGGRCE